MQLATKQFSMHNQRRKLPAQQHGHLPKYCHTDRAMSAALRSKAPVIYGPASSARPTAQSTNRILPPPVDTFYLHIIGDGPALFLFLPRPAFATVTFLSGRQEETRDPQYASSLDHATAVRARAAFNSVMIKILYIVCAVDMRSFTATDLYGKYEKSTRSLQNRPL